MKKLFEKGNRASVGHGRPRLAEGFREKAITILEKLDRWTWQLESADEAIRQRAVFKLCEYAYGKPTEHVELTGAGGEALFGTPEGIAQMHALLEMTTRPKAVEAEPIEPKGGVN